MPKEVKQALEKVDFLWFRISFSPQQQKRRITFCLAFSTWLEHDYIGDMWKRHGRVVVRQKAVQIGEARSDYDILNELGKRCTDPDYWWPTVKDALNEILYPAGLTWEDFCKRGFLESERRFMKYRTGGFPNRNTQV